MHTHKELKVNRESFPKRCDICHKSDYFDESTLHCLRCSKIIKQQENNIKQRQLWIRLTNGPIAGAIFGTLIGFIVSFFTVMLRASSLKIGLIAGTPIIVVGLCLGLIFGLQDVINRKIVKWKSKSK